MNSDKDVPGEVVRVVVCKRRIGASRNPPLPSRGEGTMRCAPKELFRLWARRALEPSSVAVPTLGPASLPRHGRACPGHPRGVAPSEDVDARDKPGHDDLGEPTVRNTMPAYWLASWRSSAVVASSALP